MGCGFASAGMNCRELIRKAGGGLEAGWVSSFSMAGLSRIKPDQAGTGGEFRPAFRSCKSLNAVRKVSNTSGNGTPLQRGRAHLSAERARACTQTRATWWASTGPRSFERGEHHARAFAIPHGPASTGPRSFERGEIRTAFGDKAASALQRGRAHLSAESGPSAQCPHAPADASTGPRSFERGEIQKRGGRAV